MRLQNQQKANDLTEKNRHKAQKIITGEGNQIENSLKTLIKQEINLARILHKNENISELQKARDEFKKELKRSKEEQRRNRRLNKANAEEMRLLHLNEIRSEIERSRMELSIQRESHEY